MKKLVIVPVKGTELEDHLKSSCLYSAMSNIDNHYVYTGFQKPIQKTAQIISAFELRGFSFLETENYFTLRVWEE